MFVLIVALGGYGGGLVAARVAARAGMPDDWRIAACDVGQGDAFIVRDTSQHVALIDAGPDPVALENCLDSLGINSLQLLVLTHFDADHVGGIKAVIGRVDTVLVGAIDRPAARAVVEQLERGGARVEQAQSGVSGTLGETQWSVLWPPASRDLEGNEGSLVIETEAHGVRALFLGDLDETAQNALLRAHGERSVDIVKVAHHGSADQSERLYVGLRARLGLISAGADNRFGHPTERILAILARAATAVERTDKRGTILVTTNNSELSVWSQR